MTPRALTTPLAQRVDEIDWNRCFGDLDDTGIAATGMILAPDECSELRDLYDQADRFRCTIDMSRHRFGRGQYRYFAHPLPAAVANLRASFWPQLLPVARDWAARTKQPAPWPEAFDSWIAQCHAAGQTRPTPLMLRYQPGDWNALHRDLYGEMVFPLQVVIGLDSPVDDYSGGEFVVVEQRPRAQSRATTLTIPQGHGIVFPTRDRPIKSARGWTRAHMRHGVSTLHTGLRHTLGLVFHDAT